MAKKDKDSKKEKAPKPQPKTKKKTVDKWKKKTWYTIVAPEEFERKEIGETLSEKPESLMGRTIKITGRELANQPKKQHIQIKFMIVKVTGGTANTEAVGHEIKDSFLRRVVRRKTSKVTSVKNYSSKDGKHFKVKIVVVTEKKISRNQRTGVMKKTEELAKQIMAELDGRKVIDELVFGTIPNKIYPVLKKIVPIKRIEITKSAIISSK